VKEKERRKKKERARKGSRLSPVLVFGYATDIDCFERNLSFCEANHS